MFHFICFLLSAGRRDRVRLELRRWMEQSGCDPTSAAFAPTSGSATT